MARRRNSAGTDSAAGAGALRSPGFLIAGVVVALAIIGAVVAVLGAREQDVSSSPPASASPSGPAPGSECRPTDTAQTVPQTAPAGVTWELFANIAIPSSPTAGPLIVKDGVARCYAHTPVGALIACQQISVRAGFGPNWRAIVEQQMVPGPGREAFAKARAGFVPNSNPGTYMQTAGFRFVSYSPQTAVIQLVSRAPDGGLWTTTVTMVWSGGEWKLQPTADGNTAPPVQEVPSLEGFVPWGGM